MSNQPIQLTNLTKTFDSTTAVDNVSLTVDAGQLFGLIGPNGAGKTTMLRILTGQLQPTSGSATVLGIDPTQEPVKTRQNVGIIPEQETPPSFLTAEEYLYFVARIRQLDDYENAIDSWFTYLQFHDQKQVLCKDLSRGTRQKLMLAQAFLHQPKVAFIDEPLINLDPIIQQTLKDYLQAFIHKKGTIFLSTHVLEIAQDICTSFGILNNGQLIHTGTMDALADKKQSLSAFFLESVGGE